MMQKLSAWSKRHPGFAACLVFSAGVHVVAIACLLVNFAWSHKLDENLESVPVEMITTSELNQIMNGEKTAKQMPDSQRRADEVADLEDHKPSPPIPDSKKDTPPPPSPEKANNDPGQDEKPSQEANAPPPPPEKPQPVAPTPPPPPAPPVEQSDAKPDAPTPPPKPDSVKPPPEEAEAVEQKPPPRPKIEVKKPKKIAKPKKVPKPRPEVKEAKEVPDPPRKPDIPTPPSLPKRTLDQVAKLLDSLKPPKEEVKQKSGNEVKEVKHSDFSLDKITALLDHDAPQRRASTGRRLTRVASLGSPTAHAEKMSPTLMAQIDGWLIDHYRGCWSYFGLGGATDYVPRVHVQMAIDGTLVTRPVLVNQPTDPNLRSLADSALRAVNKCNPMPIPPWFKSHYEAWRDRTVRFDPKEMS